MVYQTLPAEKMKKKNVKDLFRFSLAVIAIENDDEGRKQLFYLTYGRSYGVPNPPSRKNEKNFVKDFFHFSLAVIAIENNDEGRKQNFSISPMGRFMVYQTLPAEKMKIFLAKIFNILVWMSSL